MNIIQPNYPPPSFDMDVRDTAQITDLIVHHTDGPPNQTALEIDAEHRNQGWAMIGYEFVIGQDGMIWAGRPMQYSPAAAFGRNAQSINVCLTGDFEPGTPGFSGAPSAAQMQSLKELSVYLHQHYTTIVRTIGHRDVATLFYPDNTADYSTACPGQVLENMLSSVKTYTLAHLPKL